MRGLVNRHRLWGLAVDAALVAAAWWLAWQLRFEQQRPVYYDRYLAWDIVLLVVALKLPVFLGSGFYNRWWRYVSTRDIWNAVRGVVLASLTVFLVFTLFELHAVRVPKGVWFIDLLLCLALITGSRLLARTLLERPRPGSLVARGKEAIVVGAGDAAQLIVKEMLRNPALGYTPIGLVDDDPRKKNLRLHGVRVLGVTDELPQLLREHRPDELLIAIPSAPGEVREHVVEIARREGVAVKTLPGLAELVAGDFDLTRQLRPVEVEDVLGREPVEVDLDSIADYVTGEVVLVTGAGGSIGSELCRQIARLGPTRLVLFDHAEPALFEIERELVDERGFHAAAAILGDVKHREKVRQVFEKYRPAVVFHAAAYKHVPLMEANPLEAVRNNTLGTRTVAEVAVELGCEAVRARLHRQGGEREERDGPVEGARRMDRRVVRRAATTSRRGSAPCASATCSASSGSVIPIFRRQIASGGPGHRDAPGDDALLHDDSGGRAARHAGRRDGRPRADLRPRHGRAGEDRRPGREDDPPLRQGAGPRHRDRVRRRPARREAPGGARR